MNNKRRMAMQQGVTHWTSALSGTEHATTKLGARFHFRGLFLRQIDFSFDELSFIVTYLANETTICEQPWWRGLSHAERLEAASRMKMQHLHRGEEHVIWLTSMETPRSCILLYGNAEARPLNIVTTPVLNFTEGSVVGNLGAPQNKQSISSETSHASSSASTAPSTSGASDNKWRRIKRENSLRKDIHLYNKIIISGPADYIVLTASDIRESGSGAADRLQWAKQFGLERFVGYLRPTVFEPGAIVIQEGHQLTSLYLLLEGECRASVERDDTQSSSITQSNEVNSSSSKPPLTSAEAQLRHTRKFRWSDESQLPVASLGPKSTVGDISLMLGIAEPVTVRAVTTVNALTLSQEDFDRETSDRHDPEVVACIERLQSTAYDTLRFVLERVETESKNEHCDQRLKIDSLRETLRQKQPGRRQYLRNQFETSVAAVSGEDVAPVEGPIRMTRQQRKAARAFANLQHPVAAKSLGGYVQMSNKAKDDESPVADISSPTTTQCDDLLFLFPTMTKRRQLHGKALPLLPRYRGYDGAQAEQDN
ncbi:hypothetical protein PInf_003098 [Phytophthora infestans]|nr:hypothetical protein PInf_003098 [Phytophthora infestans]